MGALTFQIAQSASAKVLPCSISSTSTSNADTIVRNPALRLLRPVRIAARLPASRPQQRGPACLKVIAEAAAAVAEDGHALATPVDEEALAAKEMPHPRPQDAGIRADAVDEHGRHRNTGTMAVHAGERSGRPKVSDALTTPIVQTSTYFFKNTAELIDYQEGRYGSYEYGRYGNPTTRVVEEKISALEGAEETLLSSSGMNAATTMLLALVPAGGHIITTTDCYRRTRQFIQTVLPKMGITATVIDPSDIGSLERALDKHKTTLFFSESPTNPYLRCIDIELVSKLCHDRGALVCIDGTFATPINQTAIALGADLVLHSATKYLAGHNDVLAGTLSGAKEVIAPVRNLHNVLGGVVDSHVAYLILRGMKTLELRVLKQNDTALRLARLLEAHPKIVRVHYPGLESHSEHAIAKKQMRGFGGVVSFEVRGGLEDTSRFIDAVRLPYIAPSLGGVESLIEQPTIVSYWDQSPAERKRLGIKDNLVRFSCGIEDYADISDDILQALEKV